MERAVSKYPSFAISEELCNNDASKVFAFLPCLIYEFISKGGVFSNERAKTNKNYLLLWWLSATHVALVTAIISICL